MFKKRFARTAVFLVCAVGLTVLTGCKNKKGFVIMCGSSFVPPTQELIAEFAKETGITIETTVAGSESLLPLVKAGEEGDVLVTHDPFLDLVREAGALADSVQVGFLAPVLAVQKGNPKGIKSIEDLAREGLKVGLTDPEFSTCGEMVYALLEKKGIKEAVLKNVSTHLAKHHSTLGTWLETGVVDAVIMWNGVGHTFKDGLEVVKTPYEYENETRVHVIGLNYSKHPETLKKFLELVRQKGDKVFAEHGYVK